MDGYENLEDDVENLEELFLVPSTTISLSTLASITISPLQADLATARASLLLISLLLLVESTSGVWYGSFGAHSFHVCKARGRPLRTELQVDGRSSSGPHRRREELVERARAS